MASSVVSDQALEATQHDRPAQTHRLDLMKEIIYSLRVQYNSKCSTGPDRCTSMINMCSVMRKSVLRESTRSETNWAVQP